MKNLLIVVATLMGSVALAADVNGTIKITGSVGKMVSISSDTVNDAPVSPEGKLDATLDFGSLDLGTVDAIKSQKVGFKLRSNANYALTASVASSTSGPGAVGPEDIGFHLTVLPRVVGTGPAGVFAGSDTVNSNLKAPAGVVNHDSSDLGSTLSLLSTGGMGVLTGDRISNKGGLRSPHNALGVEATVSMMPQFFTPTTADFLYTVTLTVSAP